MTIDRDLAAAVAAATRDRAAVWSFIRDYAAYWNQPLRPGDGVGADELAAVRRRLTRFTRRSTGFRRPCWRCTR